MDDLRRCFDLFWLIEPNFKDAARNLHFSCGILEYIAVPGRDGLLLGGRLLLQQLGRRGRWCRPTIRTWQRFWSLNMPTHNTPEHDPQKQHGISPTGYSVPTPGYEKSDVKVGGIVVFLISLFVFVGVFFVFCFGMGKVINARW